MEKEKQTSLDTGCVSSGIPDTVSVGSKEPVGHKWSGWPGAYCLRCGAEQVLELAVAENWINFNENPDGSMGEEEWISEDHKEIVHLCDDFCYSDMTPEQVKEHKAKIKTLCDKIGYGKHAEQETVHPVPQRESESAVAQKSGQGSKLG